MSVSLYANNQNHQRRHYEALLMHSSTHEVTPASYKQRTFSLYKLRANSPFKAFIGQQMRPAFTLYMHNTLRF